MRNQPHAVKIRTTPWILFWYRTKSLFHVERVQTKCTNPASVYAGYQEYGVHQQCNSSAAMLDWIFSFYVCCRNCAITTLVNPCSDNMYVEATLNNLAFQRRNSSPVQFTNIPVAFVCVNQSFTYNHGVYDPNGDSLCVFFHYSKNMMQLPVQ